MIEKYLPTPPKAHHYEVEVVSPLVTKVWLCRDNESQLLEKEIRTIYCFVKGKKNVTIHKPMNAQKPYVKSFLFSRRTQGSTTILFVHPQGHSII